MFNRKSRDEDPGLDKVITQVEEELETLTADQKEFSDSVDQYIKLKKLQAEQKPQRISKDALVTAGASLAGIVLILGFEKANVITSKAMSFIVKAR